MRHGARIHDPRPSTAVPQSASVETVPRPRTLNANVAIRTEIADGFIVKRFDAEEPPHWDWADEVDVVVADADDGEFPDEYLNLSWQFEEFWEADCWGRNCLPSSRSQSERRCV